MAYKVGGRPPPRLEKFRANSFFWASSSCSKILKDKKYFNTVKNFRTNSVFQGKRRSFKILNDKKYIFNHRRTKRGVGGASRPPVLKNFRSNSVFRASVSCSKILNDKKYFNTVKYFRETLLFRPSASCSKILNLKKYIQYSAKFYGKLCFLGQGEQISMQYIHPVKAITVKFLVWENTTRKELQPLELSKITTEFAYNGTSRGLCKERYCRKSYKRIEMHVEDAIGTKENATL